MTNVELAQQLELPVSSCSDLVSTLIDIGYLARSVKNRRLYPTGRLFAMATEIDENVGVTARLAQACEELRNKTSESALCGSLHKGVVTVRAFAAGHEALRYSSARGDRLSLHVSAMGKAILAHMTVDDVERELTRMPWPQMASNTLTHPADLIAQVASFRAQGWALVENEGSEGLASMSVAGRVNGELFAIAVAGAQSRLKMYQASYLNALIKVAEKLFDETTPSVDVT
ncbi:IclR family transcriptional regulator [Variovorax sp. KK3]